MYVERVELEHMVGSINAISAKVPYMACPETTKPFVQSLTEATNTFIAYLDKDKADSSGPKPRKIREDSCPLVPDARGMSREGAIRLAVVCSHAAARRDFVFF